MKVRAAALLLLSLSLAEAFSVIPGSIHHVPAKTSSSTTAITMAARGAGEKKDGGQHDLNLFAAAAVVSASCFAFVGGAAAAPYPNTLDYGSNALQSSSIELSKTVQTMDMSMPSSYSAISDATASGVAELTQEENLTTGTKKKVAKPASSQKGGGGGGLSGLSIGGGTPLTDEEKAAAAAAKSAEREAAAAEKMALAAEKAAEREALAAQKAVEAKANAEEKAIEREANQKAAAEANAERAAAKAAADEKKAVKREAKEAEARFKGAEVMDMGLPSYSDAASVSGEKKSIFAL